MNRNPRRASLLPRTPRGRARVLRFTKAPVALSRELVSWHSATLLLLLLLTYYLVRTMTSSPHAEVNAHRYRRLGSEVHHRCESTGVDRDESDTTYVFLHLHKTAGNHLKKALMSFAKWNRLRLYHTCRPTMGDALLNSWWFHRSKRIGIDLDCNLEEFARLPTKNRSSFDFVVGHQYFGIHNLVPRRKVEYFTFVRHPIARKVSHFAHFEAQKHKREETSLLEAKTRERLVNYLLQRNRNYMVKRLAASSVPSEIVADLRSRLVDGDLESGRAAIRQAMRNVQDRFFFVGVFERYSESVCVLSRLLNAACYTGHQPARWKRINYRKLARRSGPESQTDGVIKTFSPELKQAISEVERLDMELYSFANRMLEARLAEYPECRVKITLAENTSQGHVLP